MTTPKDSQLKRRNVRQITTWNQEDQRHVITLETLSLGLPLKTGRLSADTRAGEAFTLSIWRVTAWSIERERNSTACCECSASAYSRGPDFTNTRQSTEQHQQEC